MSEQKKQQDAELREAIVDAHVQSGWDRALAEKYIDLAFTIHDDIEQYRTNAIVEATSEMLTGDLGVRVLLLVVQLEINHLRGVFRALAEQFGIPVETIQ